MYIDYVWIIIIYCACFFVYQNSGLVPHHSVLPRREGRYILEHLNRKAHESITTESVHEDDENEQPVLEYVAFDELMEAYHGPLQTDHTEELISPIDMDKYHHGSQFEREWDEIDKQARVPLFKDSKCSK